VTDVKARAIIALVTLTQLALLVAKVKVYIGFHRG
jgi:hypothetical protein